MSEPIQHISDEIDFQTYNENHSTPLFLKLYPQNNIQAFNTSSTSIYGPVQFLIPAKVLCLEDTRISFTLYAPAQGTGFYTWLNANLGSIFNRIQLSSQNSNQILADVSYLEHYNALVSPITTCNEDLQNKASSLYTTSTGSLPFMSFTNTIGASYYGYQKVENLSRSNGVLNPDCNGTDYSGAYEPRRLFFTSVLNSPSYLNIEMRLGDLVPMSIFSTKQMAYYSGEQLLLSLYFNGYNQYMWAGSSATNPLSGAITLPVPANGPITTQYPISNLVMYLKTEQNQAIATQIVDKVLTTGIQLPMAYPFMSRLSAVGLSQSQTIQLTRGWGKSLLFVAWAPFNSTETLPTSLDHSIFSTLANSGLTSSNIQTFMDNLPIEMNSNADITLGEQWTLNKDKLKGSCIKTLGNYNIDFANIDSFIGKPLCWFDPSRDWDGLDLSPEMMYGCVVPKSQQVRDRASYDIPLEVLCM